MKKKNIIVSLYTHDGKKYSIEETVELSLKCKDGGAETIHLHIDKLGGIENFVFFLQLLEEKDGPSLCLSVSDYRRYTDYVEKKGRNVQSAAIIGSDCVVFGHEISQSFENLVEGIEDYIQKGFFPEVSIFNMSGVDNCIRLNKIFPKQFFVGAYLGYPEQLEASIKNIKTLSQKLKTCSYVCYTVFNNLTKKHIEVIMAENGYIRVGMEDQKEICGVTMKDSLMCINTVSKIIDEL